MTIPMISSVKVPLPPEGYTFPFIDIDDNKLKIKTTDGTVLEFSGNGGSITEFNPLSLTDYTAFEVYPHNYDIPAGQNDELDRVFGYPIPANMTESFYIRSEQLQDKQNVIIDWGDGSEYTVLSEFQNELEGSEGDWRYLVSHTYNSTGKYIIKIYGNTYFALIHNENTSNLMSRVFDIDLPTASHLTNYSSFAGSTQLLTNINISNANNFIKNARDISKLFSDCQNILSITGFCNSAINLNQLGVFLKTKRMTQTDFKIPALLHSTGLHMIFYGNYQLNKDILGLLPSNGFIPGQTIPVYYAFYNCKKLICSNYEKLGKIFWNNKDIEWTFTDSCFATCSDDFRAHVPESWGGTAHDSIIRTNFITIQKPVNELPLFPRVVISKSPDFSDSLIIDPYRIENDELYVEAFTGEEWLAMPYDGLGDPFDDSEVLVNISRAKLRFGDRFFIKYCWVDSNGEESNYRSIYYPSQFITSPINSTLTNIANQLSQI